MVTNANFTWSHSSTMFRLFWIPLAHVLSLIFDEVQTTVVSGYNRITSFSPFTCTLLSSQMQFDPTYPLFALLTCFHQRESTNTVLKIHCVCIKLKCSIPNFLILLNKMRRRLHFPVNWHKHGEPHGSGPLVLITWDNFLACTRKKTPQLSGLQWLCTYMIIFELF